MASLRSCHSILMLPLIIRFNHCKEEISHDAIILLIYWKKEKGHKNLFGFKKHAASM